MSGELGPDCEPGLGLRCGPPAAEAALGLLAILKLLTPTSWVAGAEFKLKGENTCNMKRLTLKTPRKPASENVVCLCRLLNILANFSNLFLHTGKQSGSRSDCS